MPNKPKAYIFDVDGTLADVRSIRHYVLNKPKDFDKFHEHSVNVPAHQEIADMARKAKVEGYAIVVVTARRAKWRNQTAMWLAQNDIPSDALYMRSNKDGRKDYEVKKDILHIIRQTWDVVHAVDDNPNIIRLWNEENIPCTQVEGWVDEQEY